MSAALFAIVIMRGLFSHQLFHALTHASTSTLSPFCSLHAPSRAPRRLGCDEVAQELCPSVWPANQHSLLGLSVPASKPLVSLHMIKLSTADVCLDAAICSLAIFKFKLHDCSPEVCSLLIWLLCVSLPLPSVSFYFKLHLLFLPL